MMSGIKLSGIVEAGETFVRISYAGNHKNSRSGFKMPREAHKRGGEVRKRGLSQEQVCIPCAVNRSKLSVARIGCLGMASNKAIVGILGGHIEAGSVVCTDKSRAYKKLVSEGGLEQVKVPSGRTLKGQYGIQTVNSYHSKLKKFIGKFYGVSSKHLNNYLVYFNFLRGVEGGRKEKVKTLLDYIIGVKCYTRRNEISLRPALPLAA